MALFGVFDGHGPAGTLCASFARDHLPSHLVAAMHRHWCRVTRLHKQHRSQLQRLRVAAGAKQQQQRHELSRQIRERERELFNEAFASAFTATNNRLHKSAINDNRSGTTAVCVLVYGQCLHVANVGDSRAIMGVVTKMDNSAVAMASPLPSPVSATRTLLAGDGNRKGTSISGGTTNARDRVATSSEDVQKRDKDRDKDKIKYKARALTVDQTPFRRDERERVKAAGTVDRE